MNALPDNDWLLDEAGPGAVERGVDYYHKGRVQLTSRSDTDLTAEAQGSHLYTLELSSDDDGDWRWHCDCPAADGGAFCKHLVAAVMVARDGPDEAAADTATAESGGRRSKTDRSPRTDELRKFIDAQPAAVLADWLRELALTDRDVEQRLLLRRAAQQPDTLKPALAKLLNTGGFLDYRGAMRYAARLDEGIASLRELLTRDPDACRGLCEYAFKRLVRVYGRADDSAGAIGDRLGDIAELHQRACEAAPPRKALAKTLFDMKRLDNWSLLPLPGYWGALGAQGQRDYARRVLAEFEALPPPTRENRYGEAFGVCARVEELARCSDDFELLQRVLRRDLSEAYAHLRVFESLHDAGREREALAWIEQAVKQFPGDLRLREALADSLVVAGLHDEACEQAWQCFCLRANDQAWSRLKRIAGPKDWPDWRRRALDAVAAKEKGVVGLRIDLLTFDGDMDAALQLAREQAVAVPSLLGLAKHVRRSHPADAGAFYLRVTRAEAGHLRGASDYQRITSHLQAAAKLLPASAWQPLVTELRHQHGRKRKLMAMLDAVVGD